MPRSQLRSTPALLEVLWPLNARLSHGVVPSLGTTRQIVDIIRQWFGMVEREQIRRVLVRMLSQIEALFLHDCPYRSNLFQLSNKELLSLAFLCNHIAKCYPRVEVRKYGPWQRTMVSQLGEQGVDFLNAIRRHYIPCGVDIDDNYIQTIQSIGHDLECRYVSGEKERAYFLKSLLLAVVYNNMSRKWFYKEFIADYIPTHTAQNWVIEWDLNRLIPSGNKRRGAFQKENASLLYAEVPLRFHCLAHDMAFLEVIAWALFEDTKSLDIS